MPDPISQTRDLNDWMKELIALSGSDKGVRKLPPVEQWNPAHCGDIGMEIRADGSWWHEGSRIGRPALVELFATILRKDEDGQTYLVTPGEKVIVKVEDSHFLGVRADKIETATGLSVAITTNVGDVVVIGPEHPLRVETDPKTGEPRPYVRVRGRLDARILRPPFYDLVEWAVDAGDGTMTLFSSGRAYPLGSVL